MQDLNNAGVICAELGKKRDFFRVRSAHFNLVLSDAV